MVKTDRAEFLQLYSRLARAFRERIDNNDVKIFFEGLESYPLEAVAAAVREMIEVGTPRDRLPTVPYWGQLACEFEARMAREAASAARGRALLNPSSREGRRELAARRRARAKFLAACRKLNAKGVVAYFERVVPKPGEERESAIPAPICVECSDTGYVYDDQGRWGAPCGCRANNPVIKLRRMEQRARSRSGERARRARLMAPR